MGKKLITACTTQAAIYPGFVNISRDEDGSVVVTVRGDPVTHEDRSYICGHASDKGAHGRCTPGDERCNNYCNMAPQKGPMQDHPAPCPQTFIGEIASVKLNAHEWAEVASDIYKDN